MMTLNQIFLTTAVMCFLCSETTAYPHLLRATTNQHEIADEPVPPRDLQQTTTTAALITQIKVDIKGVVDTNPNLAPKFVRLLFHDCVGGCNGCVDMTNPDNAGLTLPIDSLQPIVDKYLSRISRADLWALAGLYSAELSVPRPPPGVPAFTFPMEYVGRTDCDAVPSSLCTNHNGAAVPCGIKSDHNNDFPSPDFTTNQLLDYMKMMFNFDARETVAIMGAHSLGVSSRENSGFTGAGGWDNDHLRLDNNYYAGIVGTPDNVAQAPGWDLFKVNNTDLSGIPDRYIWFRGSPTGGTVPVIVGGVTTGTPDIMMTSDIALVRDLTGRIASDGRVSCGFGAGTRNACPFSSTINQAAIYRADNIVWLADFRDALTKMSLTGFTSPAPTTVSPTAAPTQAPTANPTPVPTAAPTKAPTANPTPVPTAAPTKGLTSNPTTAPKRAPTANPTTAAPMKAPTVISSTKAPTRATTSNPTTKATTIVPTRAKPTQKPTTKVPLRKAF